MEFSNKNKNLYYENKELKNKIESINSNNIILMSTVEKLNKNLSFKQGDLINMSNLINE